jgi:hypothetical protein
MGVARVLKSIQSFIAKSGSSFFCDQKYNQFQKKKSIIFSSGGNGHACPKFGERQLSTDFRL